MLTALYCLLFVLGADAIALGLTQGIAMLAMFGAAVCVFVVLRFRIAYLIGQVK